MANIIIETFWLLLPAGIANMSPVLFTWLRVLKTPVDFGKTYRGKAIFGKNKTFRGLIVGILIATFVVYLQQRVPFLRSSLVDYAAVNVWLLGLLLGGGALLGDMIESFFKRQLSIAPGKSWVPFDQLDWVLGALILVSIVVSLSVAHIITALLLFGILHPLINLIGYALRIKKNKW